MSYKIAKYNPIPTSVIADVEKGTSGVWRNMEFGRRKALKVSAGEDSVMMVRTCMCPGGDSAAMES